MTDRTKKVTAALRVPSHRGVSNPMRSRVLARKYARSCWLSSSEGLRTGSRGPRPASLTTVDPRRMMHPVQDVRAAIRANGAGGESGKWSMADRSSACLAMHNTS
jgi:hypothetical protein